MEPVPDSALPAPVLNWPLASLAQTQGFPVEAVGEVDSTNTELMRRVRTGRLSQPVLLVAERQSAGRGRLGRVWQTGVADEPGSALAFSLALPLHLQNWSGLSLAVGLAVAESLHPAIRIKWPNDLWLWDGRQGRKLCGILIETAEPPGVDDAHGRIVVIGVGINIAPLAGDGFATPPAALRELRPDLDAPGALALIVPPLIEAVRAFERDGFAPLVARYAVRDALMGRWVRCLDGAESQPLEGQSLGVGRSGALRLRVPPGGTVREITSGQVSVQPVERDR